MSLPDAQIIKDSAEAKLEEQQKEKAMLEHSLQSDYLALRKLIGTEADSFIVDLVKLPF